MHESSVVPSLVNAALRAVERSGGGRATRVTISIGALCPLSWSHLEDHFLAAARGTCIEGAVVDVTAGGSLTSPEALGVVLRSVDIAPEAG